MIYITTIKELLNKKVYMQDILNVCDKLYEMTDFISEDYPSRKSWFYQKQLKETLDLSGRRDIIFAYDEKKNIMGAAFIKDGENEKKICTLFVDKKFRGMRVATKLVDKAIEILGTKKPMITLVDYRLPMFAGLIKKYGWERTQEVKGLYNENSTELVYNGTLTNENEQNM